MKCSSRLPLSLLVALSAAVLGMAETTESKTSAPPEPWSPENVEVSPSPQVTWGRLENGLRYAIMPHASPPGRVSMRLLVTAGSLNENDDERGYAHFVEHMAFNGTKHFPAGELVKLLQRQGAAFGPDVNGFTTHTHTLYKLELPEASADTFETGLRIFRDFADGILFESPGVKRERGVILSEERSLHTPDEAKRLALTSLIYQNTLVPDRQPIGLINRIEHADSVGLRKFYDAWYRPEKMVIVIVGQVEAARAETLIREHFASLAARGAARANPVIGTIKSTREPKVVAHARQENGFNINLIKIIPRPKIPLTWGTQLEGLRIVSAFNILARRLELLTQGSTQIINNSSTSLDVDFNRFRMMSVNVSSSIDNWEKALAIAEQEVRRVIKYGFTQEELVYQQAGVREGLKAFAQSLPTTSSADLAQGIVDSMEDETPFMLVGDSLDTALAMTDRLTVEDCQRSFREYWGEAAPFIFITTLPTHLATVEKVRAVYAASQNVAIDPAHSAASAVFSYEDFGPPGEVVEKKRVEDLDLWLVRFANGVRLNVKRTPFENGLIRFNVRIGTGGLSEPPDKPGLRFWSPAWLLGGVGKHTMAELTRFIDGLDSMNVGASEDAVTLSGSARTEHAARALHQLTALISDPAFRPEGHRDMAANLRGQIDPLWNTPEGPIQRFVLPSLAGNNPRIGLPDPDVLYSRTEAELHDWLAPQLASGALEVSVIGDCEVENIIAEVAKTLGALPARQPKPALEEARKLQYPQKNAYAYYYYTGPADRPSTLEFFWPVHDSITSADRRRLQMLALILEGRVTEQVREKQGATYAPSAFFNFSDTYPGLSFIRCKLQVKPKDAPYYGKSIMELAGQLAKKGITSDELARAKAQHSTRLQEWKSDNTFWMDNVVSDVQERPQRLADLRSAETDINGTTISDLNTLAHKYLDPNHIFRYIIEPSARMPKQKHP